MRRTIFSLALISTAVLVRGETMVCAAETSDYSLADPQLKVITLDTAPTESFLAVRVDTMGRVFVGGREALFVYEPDKKGDYSRRKELLHFPDHTWVYDIEIRGHDLYLMTVSALYIVRDGVTKRSGLKAERLVWGVPMGHVHQCFHGLAWGPEGDLYFSMGDPLWYYGDFNRPDHWGHWTFFSKSTSGESKSEWTRTPYNGVGGVFRVRPDGTNFQVVATGLRNSCGLVFDSQWNLFTNDNDHESMPAEYVPGRLNHVTPHAWFGWPRGWMVSKTPDRADLLDTLLTTMGRAVPVGQSYYDDAFLPEQYKNNLLVARWCTRQITRYPLTPSGATFRATEHELLAAKDLARPVGICVGRGGRLFATICYMAQNEASPMYKSDLVMITRADDKNEHPFDAYDTVTAKADKLWKEIADPSWSRRQAAHVEILRRGLGLQPECIAKLNGAAADDAALLHYLWLAGSVRSLVVQAIIERQTRHKDPAIRAQAIRALGECVSRQTPIAVFHKALADADPRVRLAAVQALFKFDELLPPQVLAAPASNDDTYLRQTTAMLIAEKGSRELIEQFCKSDDSKVRLAGVLAAGFRLTLPNPTGAIADNLPLAKWRNDDANVIQFIDAKVDLREYGRVGTYTVAEHWKAAPHTAEQEQLFALLKERLDDADERVRLQAAHFLSLLNDARTEPLIAKTRTAIQTSRLSTAPSGTISKVWIAGPFRDDAPGFATVHAPESGPLDAATVYKTGDKEIVWQAGTPVGNGMFNFRKTFGDCDGCSFYAFARVESGSRQQIMLLVGSGDGVKVWHNGKTVWTNEVVRGALPFQDVVLLDLQPGSNDLLIRVQNVTGECGLYLHYRALAPLAFVLPEKLGPNSLADRLKGALTNSGDAKLDPVFLSTDWTAVAKSGDAENGRRLFGANGLGCVKCHAIAPDAAINAGPSLADSAKRFTVSHLVESVLVPNKMVSPVFKATLVVTKQGKQHTGLVVTDIADKLELILPDATRLTLAPAEIEERKLQEISPMPPGLVKTPGELRDLLTYLLSENPKAP